MKRRNWVWLAVLGVLFFYNGNLAIRGATETPPVATSNAVHDIQLIYASPDINEVPFFVSGWVAFESGDNRDDSLALIPLAGYDTACTRYNDPALFRELENPRPDVSDGQVLVFSAIGKNGRKGIYLIDPFADLAVGKAKPAALWVNRYNNWHPALNRQRGLLAFVSDAAGAPQIFLRDLQSRKTRRLTYLAKAASPCIDAAGEWIYFSGATQNGNEDIYKIKPDGTNLARLTFSPEMEKYPTLTRHGKWLVYERGTRAARGTRATRGIWIMSLDGAIQKQISDPAHWIAAPCMNYSGTKVVFEGLIDNKRGIYLGEVSEAIFSGATAREHTPETNAGREVANLSQFGPFTPAQLQKLAAYGFLVVPTGQKQLFCTYAENELKNIPSFVTADNLLQLLDITFATSLRRTEEQILLPKLNQFTEAVLLELENRDNLARDPADIALRRYFEVLYNLLNNKPYPKLGPRDLPIVAAELARIKAAQFSAAALFPERKLDYSQFTVRGHYNTSAALRRYFKAMRWLETMTFGTESGAGRRLAYLAADILRSNPAATALFRDIDRITAFYAGPADEPNLDDFAAFWEKETGGRPDYTAYRDAKMRQVLERLFKAADAQVTARFRPAAPNPNKVLRFMGARYAADSQLFGLLLDRLGSRYQPGGLDLFAALENESAADILAAEGKAARFPKLAAALREGGPIVDGSGVNGDETPLFQQWLHLLRTYANGRENGAPAVFQTPHWQRKKLNTALASWAELKHDAVLYGKQNGAACGGGDESPKVCGYVEPELEFYRDVRNLLTSLDRRLREMGTAGLHNLNQLLELVDFFILVSEKELRGIPLATQENEQIRIIGGLLEAGAVTALDARMRRWETASESARNMAAPADIYRYGSQSLTAGVGYGDDLYIVIPVNDQLYLMRGAIFSYYEFLSEKRFSDPEWAERLKTWDIEKRGIMQRAEWWRRYLEERKEAIPAPADPYDSGC